MKTSICILTWLVLVVPCQARVIYVDANTPDNNDGSSWAKAYKYLQDGLADAESSGDVNEIRVAQGTYTPDTNSGDPNGSGDRTDTFQLINGVALMGGYAGSSELDPNARDIELFETILSGDLDGNDIQVDPCELWTEPTRNENSYNVFRHDSGLALEPNAIIDGFTITAGNAVSMGGGMLNDWGVSPTVTSCTFYGNSAGASGGGMCNLGSETTVFNCTFTGNSADAAGGGMVNSWPGYYGGYPTVISCTFSGNSASLGGGMANGQGSNPTVVDCTFTGNMSASGGGMLNMGSETTVFNCTFTGNSAEGGQGVAGGGGGGISNLGSSATVTGCTFTGNSAERGGGMYNVDCSPTVTNSILWGNTASDGNEIALNTLDTFSTIDVNYCDVQGGESSIYKEDSNCTVNWGGGNIDADPLFVAPGYWDSNSTPDDVNDDYWVEGDYHLKSEGWRWGTERQTWIWDDVTSRCIDAGNPGSPLVEELLSVPSDPNNEWGENLRINMGAYGGTAEASMPPYEWAILSDITNDGIIDSVDFAHLASIYSDEGEELFADFDRDGDVDNTDLRLLCEDWLKETTWH